MDAAVVADQGQIGHLPNFTAVEADWPDRTVPFRIDRYAGLDLDQIIASIRGTALVLLKRGTAATLLARRELGGLLFAACKKITSRPAQVDLFRNANLEYSEARRHIKLWVDWLRVERMLCERQANCLRRGVPFVTPGLRQCLKMAGITRPAAPPYDSPPAPVGPEPLPDDVDALKAIVEDLQQKNRVERADKAHLLVELDLARDELRERDFHDADEQTKGIIGKFTGWLRRRRALPAPQSERPAEIEIRNGDCIDEIETEPNIYDAIVTDPPYAISLHGKDWDSTDISFSPVLWDRFMHTLKPGGYVAFFAASRLYHRAAQAAEDAGFIILPFLAWRFRDGLCKPINLSELFDRDNLIEREVIGSRRGSGFTQANVSQGAQSRTHTTFTAHARYVSQEAQDWRGYYYGLNTLKPSMEPILLVQKPIATERMIDNIRLWGTGALNIGALQDRYKFWPNTMFTHRKARKAEHQTEHPSVKPITLMEDICTLVCPRGGRILDAFGGTGTTGIAAKRQGFDCVLIEQDAAMCAVIEERIRREG
jgi:site-specific DNA-methyltransferase (adenine-specific)